MSLKKVSSLGRGRGYRVLAIALLVVTLAGCAARSPRPVTTYGSPYEPAADTTDPSATAGNVLSVVTTPLFLAFKAVVCATTLVIAVPVAAVLAVSDPEQQGWERQSLNEGFATNCGPPYVLF